MSVLLDQIFAHTAGKIRVFGTNENPYFCGKDIAEILEYSNTAESIRIHVRDKNKKTINELLDIFNPRETYVLKGNEGATIYITEAGLYELIFSSNMPLAIEFKDWIMEVVLPTIRKTGNFQLEQKFQEQLHIKDKELQGKEQMLIQAAEQLKKSEDGKLWLNTISKENVSFKLYEAKTDGVYIGSGFLDKENSIYKIGKTNDAKKRERELATSSSAENAFKILKYYKTYSGMGIATEHYIQALLKPCHVSARKDAKGSSMEFYMSHIKFLDKITEKTISDQDETIVIINDYIRFLKENNMNIDTDPYPDIEFNYETIPEPIPSQIKEVKTPKVEIPTKAQTDTEVKISTATTKSPNSKRKLSATLTCKGILGPKHIALREEFDTDKKGFLERICRQCKYEKLDSLKQDVLDAMPSDSYDEVKMENFRKELKLVSLEDIFGKPAIIITKSYKRCSSDEFHETELDHWLAYSEFYDSDSSATSLSSVCTTCDKEHQRIKRKNGLLH